VLSFQVEELMTLYHGMTVANKKKASVILSAALKDVVAVSPVAPDNLRNNADHATPVTVPDLPTVTPQPLKKGK
jgi:hypothetical protein